MYRKVYKERPSTIQASRIDSFDDLMRLDYFHKYEIRADRKSKVGPSDPLGQYPPARVAFLKGNRTSFVDVYIGDFVVYEEDEQTGLPFYIVPSGTFYTKYEECRG